MSSSRAFLAANEAAAPSNASNASSRAYNSTASARSRVVTKTPRPGPSTRTLSSIKPALCASMSRTRSWEGLRPFRARPPWKPYEATIPKRHLTRWSLSQANTIQEWRAQSLAEAPAGIPIRAVMRWAAARARADSFTHSVPRCHAAAGTRTRAGLVCVTRSLRLPHCSVVRPGEWCAIRGAGQFYL